MADTTPDRRPGNAGADDSPARNHSPSWRELLGLSPARTVGSSPGRTLVIRAFEKAIADGVLTNEEREILNEVVEYVVATENATRHTTRDAVLEEVGMHLKIDKSVLHGMCSTEKESFFTQYLFGFIVTLLPTQFMFREHCKDMLASPFYTLCFRPLLHVFIITILFYVWLANLADLFIQLLRLFGILNFGSFLWTDAALLHLGQSIREMIVKARESSEEPKMIENLMRYFDYLGIELAKQGEDAFKEGDFCLPDTFLNATLTNTCTLAPNKALNTLHWSLPLDFFPSTQFASAAHNKVRQVFQDSMSTTGNGVADEKIMEWFEHVIEWLPQKAMDKLCELKMRTVGNLNRFADPQNSCKLTCHAFCLVLCVFTVWTLWRRCFSSRESSSSGGGGLVILIVATISLVLSASFFPEKESMHVQQCNSWLNDTWYWLSVWKGCEDFSLLLLALFFAWLIEQVKEKMQDYINPRLLTWSSTLRTGAGSESSSGSSAGAGAPCAGTKRTPEPEGSPEEPSAKKQKKNDRPAAAAAAASSE